MKQGNSQQPHPLRPRNTAQNPRAFASGWFVFLCVAVFLSGARSSNWIWPKAKSPITNLAGDVGVGAQITSPPQKADLQGEAAGAGSPYQRQRVHAALLCSALCAVASTAIKSFGEFKAFVGSCLLLEETRVLTSSPAENSPLQKEHHGTKDRLWHRRFWDTFPAQTTGSEQVGRSRAAFRKAEGAMVSLSAGVAARQAFLLPSFLQHCRGSGCSSWSILSDTADPVLPSFFLSQCGRSQRYTYSCLAHKQMCHLPETFLLHETRCNGMAAASRPEVSL